MQPFGRALRPLWLLEPGATFLNHGSYGACPRPVREAQERWRLAMESQPDRFFRREIVPAEGRATALRDAIARLAGFLGTEPDRLALVENATAGVQAVLRSLSLNAGDEILVNDHTYNAVRLMVEARCAETGARPRVVTLPLPATADDLVGRFRDALTPAVRLVIVDHITSPTALVMPLARMLPELRRWNARVLVDGAHGVGQLDLDLDALGADWYVSNAHKWLWAPRGTAFLHASREAAALTQPLVVSHYAGLGFPRAFDYVGTRDYTAWLALPAAIDFFHSLDPPRAAAWRRDLIAVATGAMAALGAEPVGSGDLGASLRSFRLPWPRTATPADAIALVNDLWERDRIQSMSVAFGGALLLRVSAQVYVEPDDVRALAAALERRISASTR